MYYHWACVQIMSLVELDTIKDNIVGIEGTSGLSAEQRKRLTIAVELVGCPAICFLDEPTSGEPGRLCPDAQATASVPKQPVCVPWREDWLAAKLRVRSLRSPGV